MDWQASRPLVLAHRGFTQKQVENTLAAVEAALRLGVDGIEVDLRLSADGELVLFHDKDLKRLAGRDESIEEMTLSGLREVLLGGQERVPSLEELLDLVRDRALLNLELKTVPLFSRRSEERLLTTLRAFHLEETILVSSFHPLPLARLRKMVPRLRRGYLVSDRYLRTRYRPLLARWVDPFSINSPWQTTTEKTIHQSHQEGRRIFVWTVNEPNAMKRLLDRGVDGIFTDRPDELLTLMRGMRWK